MMAGGPGQLIPGHLHSRQLAGISEAKQSIAGVSYGIISSCICGKGIHE